MFTNVSWASYLLTTALLCLSWYIYVGLKYYRRELQAFFKGNKAFSNAKTENGHDGSGNNFFIDDSPSETLQETVTELGDALFRDVDHLISHIKQLSVDTIQKNTDKQAFTDQLRIQLAAYPTIKKSVFRHQVNELIAQP